MIKLTSLILVVGVAICGCAKKTASISATPISADKAAKIAAFNCGEIMQAIEYTDAKLARAGQVQDSKASDDKLMVAGGVAVFLPLLLFTEGNKGAAPIAEMKGVLEALEGQAALKKCKRSAPRLL